MKLLTSSLTLALFSLLAPACADAPSPSTAPGDPGATPTEDVGGFATTGAGDEAPAYAADAPCGAATVATVAVNASTVAFCLHDGVEGLGETHPLGTISELRARDLSLTDSCLGDIFHTLAPDRATPPALVASCADRRPVTSTRAKPHHDPSTEETQVASSYCNASGATNFRNERCSSETCVEGASPCSVWCITDLWGWHQRTESAQLGENGNWADETVASCGGTTRFRAWSGDSLQTLSLDYSISAGYYATWQMWTNGYTWDDTNFRFRGDSASGASHRHTGTFQDW